ncbi:unnamed protein product [marine sediment metagenome]|uniref:Uncharacterized protein n=1 Tax=marine sediment metagenome TaxID=412755 RepID=X1T2V8_9ZZZZ
MTNKPESPPLFQMMGASGLGDLPEGSPYWCTQITLRDLFAAAALVGLCGHGLNSTPGDNDDASLAYKAADAMLAEREKK